MENANQTSEGTIGRLIRTYHDAAIVNQISPGLRYSRDIYHFKNKHVITSTVLLQDSDLFMDNIAPLINKPCHDIHIICNPFTIDHGCNVINVHKRIIDTIALLINDTQTVILYFPKEIKAFRYFVESELRDRFKKAPSVKFRYLPKSLKFCIQEKTNHVDKRYLDLYTDDDFELHERIIINESISCQHTVRKNYYEFLGQLKDYEFNAGINASQRDIKSFIIDEFKTRNNKNIISSFPDDDSIWEYIIENSII